MLGPLPPPLGGATVLFDLLVRELGKHNDLELTVIRTNHAGSPLMRSFHLIHVLWQTLRALHSTDVVTLHASLRGALRFCPILSLVCRMSRTPWIFRGFGGGYAEWYERVPAWRRWLFDHSLLRANVVLLETQQLVEYFQARAPWSRIAWFPNHRRFERNVEATPAKDTCRFVYLGHVQPSKGVLLLRDAACRLKPTAKVDIYGPLREGLDAAQIESEYTRYCGTVAPEEVASLLGTYDALVFPTMYSGEGYPGVVLEAYGAGLPVITTRFRAIPEIVDDSCGILIAPNSVSELVDAMAIVQRDAALRARLAAGAARKAQQFEVGSWSGNFLENCRNALRGGVQPRASERQ